MESTEDIVKTYIKTHTFEEMCSQLRSYIVCDFPDVTAEEAFALNFIHREYFIIKQYTFQDFVDAIKLAKDEHGI